MTATTAQRSASRSSTPTLREERKLLRDGHVLVAGMDEVGRGALAGPVTVGVVVVDGTTRSAPPGLRDSKLLTPAARDALAPRLRRWAPAWAVGHAEPEEIDGLGIIAALRLAGSRALVQLGLSPTIVLLDGSHDWLSPPAPDLLTLLEDDVLPGSPASPLAPVRLWAGGRGVVPPPRAAVTAEPPSVRTMVKADLRCAAVAAASVLAKTARDRIMVERAASEPRYLWADNKGYSAPEHTAALARYGPTLQHRLSWRLPGVGCCWNGRHDGSSGVADEQTRERGSDTT